LRAAIGHDGMRGRNGRQSPARRIAVHKSARRKLISMSPLSKPPPFPGIESRSSTAARTVQLQGTACIWTVRESARVMVRRIRRKHGYTSDLQGEATRIVLEQAELMCADWAV
jgi:hypothetical protein